MAEHYVTPEGLYALVVQPRRSPRTRPLQLEMGKSVLLRKVGPGDEDEFLALARTSRKLHRPWAYPPSDEAAFRGLLRRSRKDDFECVLVCRREDEAIVGVYTLGQIFRGGFQNAYLGYYGRAGLEGRGYMTEGLELMLRYAFSRLKLHRLEANVQPGNTRSTALLERCGFRLEGYSPRYLKVGGRWCDHERWAITAEDWRARPRYAGGEAPRARPQLPQ